MLAEEEERLSGRDRRLPRASGRLDEDRTTLHEQ
jgi:hypothetical protein